MRRGAPRDVLYGLQQRAAEAPVALGVLRREEGDLQVAGPAPDGGGAHRLGVDQQLRQRVMRRPQLPADTRRGSEKRSTRKHYTLCSCGRGSWAPEGVVRGHPTDAVRIHPGSTQFLGP